VSGNDARYPAQGTCLGKKFMTLNRLWRAMHTSEGTLSMLFCGFQGLKCTYVVDNVGFWCVFLKACGCENFDGSSLLR
jgi:hypothetical protein